MTLIRCCKTKSNLTISSRQSCPIIQLIHDIQDVADVLPTARLAKKILLTFILSSQSCRSRRHPHTDARSAESTDAQLLQIVFLFQLIKLLEIISSQLVLLSMYQTLLLFNKTVFQQHRPIWRYIAFLFTQACLEAPLETRQKQTTQSTAMG